MGKIHKIKRAFAKLPIPPVSGVRYELNRFCSVHFYQRFDKTWYMSLWWGSYKKLLNKLEREYLERVGQAD